MDIKSQISEELKGQGFVVLQLKTVEQSIFSYYVESAGKCVVIDPTFDVSVYEKIISQRKCELQAIFLTHYHADYLSGHTQFTVPLFMGPQSARTVNKFPLTECPNGKLIALGDVGFQVIHTPGHTLQSSCFLLRNAHKEEVALFSGDTIFLGQFGRPDLACSESITVQDLAGMLYDSIQRLKKVNPKAKLFPGHGAGSSCGKAIGAGNSCTLQNQIIKNVGFSFQLKEQFIQHLLKGISQPPKYFFHDAKLNQSSLPSYTEALKNCNRALNYEQFKALSDTIPIIDTRKAPQHIIKGSYWLSAGGTIALWLTFFLKPEDKFVVVCDSGKHEQILGRFLRVGYFNAVGYADFKIGEWKGQLIPTELIGAENLKDLKEWTHLDVRNRPEYELGVIHSSILIPLPELEKRTEELRQVKGIVINCKSGLRARVAFSILARHGIHSLVLAEAFDKFKEKGINVVPHTI